MSRRRRALLLTVLALAAAGLAVTLVNGYSTSLVDSYGAMRPVLVVTSAIGQGKEVSPEMASQKFEVRRIPVRFAPAGAVSRADQAVGLETAGPLYIGSYLTSNLLRPPESKRQEPIAPGRGRHAVEISVSGAGALTGTSGRVDVLVTTEARAGSGDGRTYVAARQVPLIAIGRTGASDAGVGLTQVTLGLSRQQAIDLVEAESFARRVTILPGTSP
ncbi:MAG: hypothetical protein JJE13_08865 [Thermoleophilia bacterium]|nr:hypothetical protein [Thermoleophilia bacterium]